MMNLICIYGIAYVKNETTTIYEIFNIKHKIIMLYTAMCSIIGGGGFYIICKYIMNSNRQGNALEISRLLTLFGFIYGIAFSLNSK